jgi:hypothetical protein
MNSELVKDVGEPTVANTANGISKQAQRKSVGNIIQCTKVFFLFEIMTEPTEHEIEMNDFFHVIFSVVDDGYVRWIE